MQLLPHATFVTRLSGNFASPRVGSEFLGFRLLKELGQGSFGRVYLAEQPGLANRKVVLKIARDIGEEAQKLAQLQHTHVVPVYSVHQAHRSYQVLCMPYLGETTLEDVQGELSRREKLPESAEEFLSILRAKSACPVSSLDDAVSKQLAGRSYVEAVLWIGKCLAEGLAHAHERGIIHHDLKPANVLITHEGQPMLLDFNISEDVKDGADTGLVSGTLPYMAPETLTAIRGEPSAIDGRCDIYALGILLYELLTNRPPFLRHGGGRELNLPVVVETMLGERRLDNVDVRRWNAAVSPAAEAIVRRCLRSDPRRRYRSARALAEDLQCQLEHRPLKHVKEPSLRERMSKWLHHHPRFAWKLCGVAAGLLLVAAIGLAIKATQHARGERAFAQLEQFRHELSNVQNLLSAGPDDAERREQGLRRGKAAVEQYDVLANDDWVNAQRVSALPAEEQQRLKEQMGELLLLLARAHTLSLPSPIDERRKPLEDALALNARAEKCFAESAIPPALWLQRADLLRQVGETAKAAEVSRRAAGLPARTANDLYLLSREHLAAGRIVQAIDLLREATRLDPRHYWAWFSLANCHDEQGSDARAITCYSVCIALAPKGYEAYFNRGLAYLRQKDNERAIADFDQSIAMRPDVADGYANRALARQGLKQYAEAVEDLTTALGKEGAPTRLYFMRARARERAGDKAGAKKDHALALKEPPNDEKSWIARGLARLASDPQGALEDFEAALRVNPRSRSALQNKAHVLAEKLGKSKESIDVLSLAISLFPEYAPARIGRAVLYARHGDRDRAVRDAEDALARDSKPLTKYQAACVYALTAKDGKADAALAMRYLREAVGRGFGADLLAHDTDLDPLRSLSEFQQLVRAATLWRTALQNSGRKN